MEMTSNKQSRAWRILMIDLAAKGSSTDALRDPFSGLRLAAAGSRIGSANAARRYGFGGESQGELHRDKKIKNIVASRRKWPLMPFSG